MNKKLIWIIVIIALIVISVTVVLILQKPKVKPNPIDVQCKFACEGNQRTAFCFVERKVDDELTATCDELSKNPIYAKYNVQTCPAISCVLTQKEEDKTCITGLGGTWEFPAETGRCKQFGEEIRRKLNSSDAPPVSGQICCR